jgi:hypothetical protein
MNEVPKRANVQSSGKKYPRGEYRRDPHAPVTLYKPDGTIAWWEHEKAWETYAKKYGRDQSALRIHERWGFSYSELMMFLGHEPETWEPR